MNEKKSPAHPSSSRQPIAVAEADQSNQSPRKLVRVAVLVGIVAVVLASLAAIESGGVFQSERPQTASADVQVVEIKAAQTARTNCADIGFSDLRSPAEGVWFQTNCSPSVSTSSNQVSTACNRTSMDKSFTPIGPGLFVSRLNPGAEGFLWYASADACFDLVSVRVVTAVCVDQRVSFNSGRTGGCSGHGGVLAWVNAP